MDKYYQEFEDTEENKFIYTDIFKEYVSRSTFCISVTSCSDGEGAFSLIINLSIHQQVELLENHIEQSLLRRMPDFNMESFMRSLK